MINYNPITRPIETMTGKESIPILLESIQKLQEEIHSLEEMMALAKILPDLVWCKDDIGRYSANVFCKE